MQEINNGGVCTSLGFSANAVSADVKGNGKTKLDMTLLMSEQEFVTAAVFTTNLVKAAPVKYDMTLLTESREKLFSGVIVNSGNANACTGEAGLKACSDITSAVEKLLELKKGSLLISSTGVIGKQMPVDRMLAKLPELCDGLEDEHGSLFAEAIMTTDTVKKEIAYFIDTPEGGYSIGGACKGAGMIDPSMATLLAYVTTDADIEAADLQKLLSEVVQDTFNCVTVDGDRSTNDTLFAFANGMSDVEINTAEKLSQFKEALRAVCKWMAISLARDGEGATKLVTIAVKGAKSKEDALKCASTISNSCLVKTMFAGCDPNWGRLMSSAGASGASFDESRVKIFFNDLPYVENGMIIDEALESKVYEIMKTPEYSITLDLGAGSAEATYYTCDLTKEYVAINADYRS